MGANKGNRMVTRRALLGAIVAGLVAPQLAFAQPARAVSVIVLFPGDSEDDERAARPFFDAMRRLGWVEGQNITYERLGGRGVREYVDGLAKSAAGAAPDLIYATTATIAIAVVKATDSVPVVFTMASDPVAAGVVASLAKPGRNATGAYQAPGAAVQKRFELVREAFPRLKRMGVLYDRGSPEFLQQKATHQAAARRMGLELSEAEFTNFEAVPKILANFRREGIIAAGLAPSFTLVARRREVGQIAARNRIGLVAHRVEWAEAGALITYGAEIAEVLRRGAAIADRILKGAPPANTPVEQATKFELIVNQRTAKTLGLKLPQSLLRRADQVIE